MTSLEDQITSELSLLSYENRILLFEWNISLDETDLLAIAVEGECNFDFFIDSYMNNKFFLIF